jgi:hypothetical protein
MALPGAGLSPTSYDLILPNRRNAAALTGSIFSWQRPTGPRNDTVSLSRAASNPIDGCCLRSPLALQVCLQVNHPIHPQASRVPAAVLQALRVGQAAAALLPHHSATVGPLTVPGPRRRMRRRDLRFCLHRPGLAIQATAVETGDQGSPIRRSQWASLQSTRLRLQGAVEGLAEAAATWNLS